MSDNCEIISGTTVSKRSSFERMLAFSLGDEKAEKCVKVILEKYGSISTAFSETEEELCRVCGIGMNTALLIKLAAYVNSRRITDSFRYGERHTELELRDLIGALFLGASVETVYLILLDDKGCVISAEYIGEGTVCASDVHPRKLIECAIKKKSKNVILAHNHPKGNPSPSKEDIITTGRLFNVLASAGIRLCAHYLVGDGKVGMIESDMIYNPDFMSTFK